MESQHAVEEYFRWMTDVTGAWHICQGCGGAGAACTESDPNYAAQYIYNSNLKFYVYTNEVDYS